MKGLLVLYDGFEDCEALVTRALLNRVALPLTTATLNPQLEVMSSSGLCVKADANLATINPLEYDFLVIPGGPYVAQIIEKETFLLKLIQKFVDANKVIGAICSAPMFLGKLDLLKNHPFTCFPSCNHFIEGTYLPDQKAVISDKFVTSRSPITVFDFVFALVEVLKGKAFAFAFKNSLNV
ncbi:thiazole biosynthesis protein ThiJ [Hydrangea phyllody phytoplasma]|uniref:Thiazole biosynthesis protein ThiJ n=2 Tax=16SrI (Aster yellows group) TaxID=3042590 RepID=A0ABQ5PSJ7_9MOLU|nr:DJ-1/PfpI family protein [Hydrangea phyllody phytoplasma]GFZ75165.1 thiazole biosynthesis protein ThiJ [Hydrangea phyllody phytoplasma]GLH61483.1 thiazole biosynthesis protein ThiJ [Rhus yellows phytoplasma]GLH61715.1 thiazole biosynthesis protein ThiJ [Hydrangea phyllody phytoplasma]